MKCSRIETHNVVKTFAFLLLLLLCFEETKIAIKLIINTLLDTYPS